LAPALTLGCGTWGGSITSDNVTPLHLINIKRLAYHKQENINQDAVKDIIYSYTKIEIIEAIDQLFM